MPIAQRATTSRLDREQGVILARSCRERARRNSVKTSNTGLSPTVYANLVVVPAEHAESFADLCARNPVPLPLLERLPVGSHETSLAADSLVSTDVPLYNIYRDGILIKEGAQDVKEEWSKDHVGFLMGCSFTLETALARAGLAPRNMIQGTAAPVYVTTVPLNPAGPFVGCTVVVTMRWYKPDQIEAVRAATRPLTRQHGEPIAWGWEAAQMLGVEQKIRDERVDLGDWSIPEAGEVPVFWGCGVTGELALQRAKLPGISMTHRPG